MKILWEKSEDWIDGTPRYTIKGRDPQNSAADLQVVITTERKRKYSHDSKSVKNFYTGYVAYIPNEYSDYTEEFESIKEAKKETEKLFNEYIERFGYDELT